MARRRSDDDQGIEHEPHLTGRGEVDPSEARADRVLSRGSNAEASAAERAMHSVYDELPVFPPTGAMRPADPDAVQADDWYCEACGFNLRGLRVRDACPECGHSNTAPRPRPGQARYATFLADRVRQTSENKSWIITATVTLLGGVWAVFGTLITGTGPLGAIVFGPVLEEVMKIAAVLVIVETRPWLFKSTRQIVFAAIASAAVFAIIENVLYLNVYVRVHAPMLALWRWTICVMLHTGCTALAVVGVVRIWQRTMRTFTRPQVDLGMPWLVAAAIVHGAYNGLVTILEVAEVLRF